MKSGEIGKGCTAAVVDCLVKRVCVHVQNDCAVEILWLMLNDLCATKQNKNKHKKPLRDRLEFVRSPDVNPSG